MTTPTIRVQEAGFDLGAEAARLTAGREDIGGLASFVGLCRADAGPDGESLAAMVLEHYPGMTEHAITRIAEEACARWPLSGCTVIHRVGRLPPGAEIVLALTASSHRAAALESCAFLIDWLKTRAPFWKRKEIRHRPLPLGRGQGRGRRGGGALGRDLTLGPLARLELPCRDPHRQREFFGRVLGLPPIGTGATFHFAMGGIELVLRARGDALFPMGRAEAGALLAFPVADAELDRWHRRVLTARVAVLDAPGPGRRRRGCCGSPIRRAMWSSSSPRREVAGLAGRGGAAGLAGGAEPLPPGVQRYRRLLLAQKTIEGWAVWDKPLAYGLALHAFHWRVSLWGPLAAQGLLLSWLLWLAQRGFTRMATPGRHLLLCAGLAAGTAAPWFAALLMPDILAPALVLALALLGFAADRLSRASGSASKRWRRWRSRRISRICRWRRRWCCWCWRWRGAGGRRCAAPCRWAWRWRCCSAPTWRCMGHFALSPFGAVFALARLVADGPAARTIEARCPAAGWLSAAGPAGWTIRMPSCGRATVHCRARRAVAPAPERPDRPGARGRAILAETLWREPLAVVRAAAGNAWTQFRRARVGDALGPENLAGSVGRKLAIGFPAAEQAQFAAGMQARGLLPVLAAPFLALHPLVLLLGAAATLFGWRRAALAGDARMLGLVLAVLVGVTVNAAVTGALSGPHDRYPARIAWLLPLTGLLALGPAPVRPASMHNEAPPARRG